MHPLLKSLFTVDVEEWYQTVLFEPGNVDFGVKTDLPRSVGRILSMLDSFGATATFFMLGCVAEKYPSLAREIASRGHEVASHGYSHRLVQFQSWENFVEEISRSKEVLTRLAGEEVWGYRAPTWSLRGESGWRMVALLDAGYRYDASLYPVALLPRWRGGIDERRFPRRLDCGLWEFPPSTSAFCGWNIPFAGGTFLRFQALSTLRNRVERIHALGRPAMLYCHSWEFSETIPSDIHAWKRLLQFSCLASVETKLRVLLGSFAFRSVRDYFKDARFTWEDAR